MVFPGLKKLGKEFGFKNNGTYFYGFINNTYVMFADGANQKNVNFIFPIELNEDDKKKILSWKRKGYAKTIDFFTISLLMFVLYLQNIFYLSKFQK